jgi:VanZ family protein
LFPEQRRRPNKKVPDESAQKIKRRERFILYAPLLIWIGVIFLLSSGQGASSRTSLIIRPILEFLFPAAFPETIDFYHGVIRKFAHFTEYAVLGLLACRAFAKTHQASLRRFFYLAAILLIFAVAASDEFNQSFNPERTASPIDVLIDVSGGLAATAFYYVVIRRDRVETKAAL